MELFRLFAGADREIRKSILLVTSLAGLANAALLALVNLAAADTAAGRPVGPQLTFLYLLAVGVYVLANNASLGQADALLHQRLDDLRLRIADKIRRCELRAVERIGRGEIYAVVAQEMNHLAQNFPLLVGAAQSIFLAAFCLLYIGWLSQVSFMVMALAVLVGLLLFGMRRRRLAREMTGVHAHEAAMLESLGHFAQGFQEIRLNAAKNEALYRAFVRIVDDLETVVADVGRNWVVLLMFSNAFMFAMLGVVVFVLPVFFAGYTDVIYKIAAAALFCVGPVVAIFSVAHLYSRANVGLGYVYALERELDAAPREAAGAAADFRGFRGIALRGIHFQYTDAQGRPGFATGPWDLDLPRGQLLFLRGGNGDGKSTLIKILCGLYRPDQGSILVDGVPVDDGNIQSYRELFSAIFTDFHLFDRLYGLEDVDPAAVQALIDRMELTGKVGFANGRFTTLELSTGQRKRLAMIVSLLEDREVYVFDEWAADQDAHFRQAFYTELLPELRARGKTVVAVTHDDRFWHLGDRLLTLERGRLLPGD